MLEAENLLQFLAVSGLACARPDVQMVECCAKPVGKTKIRRKVGGGKRKEIPLFSSPIQPPPSSTLFSCSHLDISLRNLEQPSYTKNHSNFVPRVVSPLPYRSEREREGVIVTKVPDCYKSATFVTKVPCCSYKSAHT